MYCVFCSTPRDERITRKDDIDWYVCGSCTLMMMNAPQEVLRSAYNLAIKRELPTKALALVSFMGKKEKEPNLGRFKRERKKKKKKEPSCCGKRKIKFSKK